ncbi:MAG: lipopolysaccharide heptosyltransferase II [Bacteroidetes bacterium]|nr:lipopolysaccharide heptosyltransferase II [Bacteroidota bacterium]
MRLRRNQRTLHIMNEKAKILIIRFSSIGDIVLSSLLIRILRKRFPASQIDFVVRDQYAELIRCNPYLNSVIEFRTGGGFNDLHRFAQRIKQEKYDLLIDIHNSLRSRYIRYLSGAGEKMNVNKRIFARTMLVKFKRNYYYSYVSVADRYIESLGIYGIKNDLQGLELFIPDEIADRVSNLVLSLKSNRFGKIIGLCPSARHFTKRWPEERFIEAGVSLSCELNAKIIIFGGKDDTGLCTAVKEGINKRSGDEIASSFCGKFSLFETAAAIKSCDLIVTNDSGLMHIAAAMKRKIVAIFGSTVREFGFFPIGSENIVLEKENLYCRPCSHIGRKNCPERHFRCMNEITASDVVKAVKKIAGEVK